MNAPPAQPKWGRWRQVALVVGVLALIGVLIALVVLGRWAQEGAEMARVHQRHELSHKGWSFPARVYSRSVPLDAPPERLIAEAKARGYREDCSEAPAAGTWCERQRTVVIVPRQGNALEPVLLGYLIGPDAELREHLPLEQAPKHLIHALLAAEDRDFFEHSGVNLKAMLRAAFANVKEGGYAQGGSTLSMQVVRSLSQRRVKTTRRKLEEMGLALGLERELGKNGVLQMYLDIPYMGQRGGLSVCGFAAAARHYFGKDVGALSKAEAATLVAILPSPGTFGKQIGTEELAARTRRVLKAMSEQFGEDVEAALKETVRAVDPQPLPERHPSYLSATRLWLESQLPPEVLHGAGLVVETAIDLPLQEQTERELAEKLQHFEKRLGRDNEAPLQAAGVALETTSGLIRSIYGGTNSTSSGLNRALQSRRQPGSSFKPVVFALAFSQRKEDGGPRFTAATLEPNSPRDFITPDGPWRPRNVASEYSPTASLAFALVWSQNIATASLLEDLGGPQPLIDFASRLGFDTSSYPREPGLALGQAEATPLEMAEFVALIANGGRQVDGRTVVRAVDAAGKERIPPPLPGSQVLEPEAAALTRELMRQVIAQGTGYTSRGINGEPGYRGEAIGKTGTTDSERDIWFIGSTPAIAMSLWVGYDQPARVGASAMDVAAPLWGWWMHQAMRYETAEAKFPADPEIVRRWVCTESGKLANETCRAVGAPFLPGTEPRQRCSVEHPPREEPPAE